MFPLSFDACLREAPPCGTKAGMRVGKRAHYHNFFSLPPGEEENEKQGSV
jgi:hypothetical protein